MCGGGDLNVASGMTDWSMMMRTGVSRADTPPKKAGARPISTIPSSWYESSSSSAANKPQLPKVDVSNIHAPSRRALESAM